MSGNRSCSAISSFTCNSSNKKKEVRDMRKRMYFIGVMAQVGTFSTIALLLWWMTKMDVLKLFCISAVVSSMISLPILMQIERWVNGVE